MDDTDFEGTLVLEQLAAIGKVDEFFEAVDSDDVDRATALMKRAEIDKLNDRDRRPKDGGERRRALTPTALDREGVGRSQHPPRTESLGGTESTLSRRPRPSRAPTVRGTRDRARPARTPP